MRCKLTKHHFTLFLCIVSSVSLACFTYAGFLKLAEILWGISIQHEAGYICAMLFIIPGFPFITSGIDLAKLDMRSGMERFAYAILVILVATMAAWIGAVANTLRLEFVDLTGMPPAVAAFIGALTAGILASLIKNRAGYPRISVTVPSIVIMVPGLYLYRGFYNLGMMSLSVSASWFASAMLIVMALPLGLIFARILTDRSFRYCT